MILAAERELVCEYARRMVADGLVVGTSGNVSVRSGEYIAVTPSGVDYQELESSHIPVLSTSGDIVDGGLKPTSELPTHLTVYNDLADPDGLAMNAVVHTHSTHATAVSTLVTEVPSIHYMLAAIGPTVRVADYASYGTADLAQAIRTAIDGRRGCLLANHGTLTYGDRLAAAYDRARQLEWVCQVWLLARSAGEPRLLPSDELDHVVDKLRGYGQV